MLLFCQNTNEIFLGKATNQTFHLRSNGLSLKNRGNLGTINSGVFGTESWVWITQELEWGEQMEWNKSWHVKQKSPTTKAWSRFSPTARAIKAMHQIWSMNGTLMTSDNISVMQNIRMMISLVLAFKCWSVGHYLSQRTQPLRRSWLQHWRPCP